MTEDARGRVLLVSDPLVSTQAVLQTIAQRGGDQHASGALPWRLDTKYYTAEVLLEAHTVAQCSQLSLDTAGCEAVLLVFDAAQPDSFQAVARWWEGAGGGDADLGVRLAVALAGPSAHASSAPAVARPAVLTEAEAWCAEHLVELVEVAGEEEEAVAGAAAASDSREGATGVHRIREALEAHMWCALLARLLRSGMVWA